MGKAVRDNELIVGLSAFSTSGYFARVWTHGATCKPMSATPKKPNRLSEWQNNIRILSPDCCSETRYEAVSSKLYNWARGREAQKAWGRIECSGKTTCQGLWESQRSNAPPRARIFQPAAERAHSSDSRWSKKCFIVCLMNLLIMNSIPWLPVDRDSGAVPCFAGIWPVIHFITVCQVDQLRQ